jgi:hypothetical protein
VLLVRADAVLVQGAKYISVILPLHSKVLFDMPLQVRAYLLFLIGVCVQCGIASNSQAQMINPYARISDPRAITHLDGDDAEPLHYRCAIGYPDGRDSSDMSYIVAFSNSTGILTHIWMQLQDQPDSAATLKLWIDDTLVLSSHFYSFFRKVHGILRPPLDSEASGAEVCDVQIPFRHSFRITFNADWTKVCCLFIAAGWRTVLDSNKIESFRLNPSPTYMAQQTAAEKAIERKESPWANEKSFREQQAKQLSVGDTLFLASVDGPGLLHTIHIVPSTFDFTTLQHVYMQIFFDNSPYPSVDVPIGDFFGVAASMHNVKAFELRADSANGFLSYFPMPFYVHARAQIVNKYNTPITISAELQYTKESVDRKTQGYFQAQFQDDNITRFLILHPVAKVLGRGRYIGMHLALPYDISPYYLEGDPIFSIDSNNDESFRYTGGEDYFDGGWFFSDGAYSLPFAGCTAIWTSDYRFHYADAVDFKKSFNFNFEHGTKNDFKAWYRTVAFLYVHWTPFWVDRDTVKSGESWAIAGSGYQAGEHIIGLMDTAKCFETDANAQGAFAISATIPASWNAGLHYLSVNGETRPQGIQVVAQPTIFFVRDTLPHVIHWGDTVQIYGAGFTPGKHLSFRVDTAAATLVSPVTVDDHYRFSAVIRVPWLPDGSYPITAFDDGGENAVTDSNLHITRTINYEIENMWPPLIDEAFSRPDYMGYFYNPFSEHYYVLFQPDKAGPQIELPFQVPVADTFQINFFGGTSPRFGDYQITIDDKKSGIFSGYADRDPNDPIRSLAFDLGIHYLDKGQHTITFTCVGNQPKAIEHLLGADNIVLTPTTKFHALPPTSAVAPSPVLASLESIVSVYPNPVATGDQLHIRLALGNVILDPSARVRVVIYDLLGREVSSAFDINVGSKNYILNAPMMGLPNGNYFCTIRSVNGLKIESLVRAVQLVR